LERGLSGGGTEGKKKSQAEGRKKVTPEKRGSFVEKKKKNGCGTQTKFVKGPARKGDCGAGMGRKKKKGNDSPSGSPPVEWKRKGHKPTRMSKQKKRTGGTPPRERRGLGKNHQKRIGTIKRVAKVLERGAKKMGARVKKGPVPYQGTTSKARKKSAFSMGHRTWNIEGELVPQAIEGGEKETRQLIKKKKTTNESVQS